MEWLGLAGTGLGAIVGVGATLLADRVRWRRDSRARERETLRLLYAEYLEAIAAARDEISRASADVEQPLVERALAAHRAVREHEIFAKQYQLELSAPPAVAELVVSATQGLVDYRDAVAGGATREDDACTAARRAFRAARKTLMEAMRATLVAPR
ncbi:hypothetical protein FBY35_3910 [Streptomyces sp. SLBN-118]|uniref:hypothetical protein n=1 Tax=Streptomyces sp. SLBN-118 TaxID=2768454 RepID=UPI0011525FAC|nr:hypothetical protein [Streptomyces sp. SLBN-118]TQK42496.1 hypothetical protein FBY35_3910 [Streptomyces sp. SLBN-118]